MSLLQMSFSGAVLILAIIVVRAVAINRLPKKMFLFLWGVTLVRLLIPFSIPSPASVYSFVELNTDNETLLGNMLPIMPGEQMESLDGVEPMVSPSIVEQAQVQQLAKQIPDISIWQVAWCIGAAVCAAFFTIFYLHWLLKFRIARLVHNSYVEQWIEEHRLKRPISIKQSDRIDTPLTYGISHPVILLPEDTNWEDIQQIKYILQHEYIHICRFDTVTKLVCALAVCIHWFNPFVWVMYLLFNRDLELSCDERVVRQFGIGSRKTYARVLISMEAKRSDLMPFYNNFSKNAIEKRITSIMKIRKTSTFAVLIAVVLIIGITTACATSATKPEDNEISAETQTNPPDSDKGNNDPANSTEEAEKILQEYLISVHQWRSSYVLESLDPVLGEIENEQVHRFEMRNKEDADGIGGSIIANYAITTDGERIFWYDPADDEWVQQSGNGAVDNTALNSDANAESIFKAVLLGDSEFICILNGNIETMDITDVPSIFDADDPFMKIWDFAAVDLDRDGEEEVVLFAVGAAGDMGGKLILHQIGDKVYGYISDNRTLEELKTDGTFLFSDPTGVVEGGIGVITSFSELGYIMDKISYGTGTNEGWNTFIVDHQPATEEDYFNAVAIQNEKPYVEWYDFTNENINSVLLKSK